MNLTAGIKHLIKKQCFYRQPKNQINVLKKVAVRKYVVIVIEKVMYVCSVKNPPSSYHINTQRIRKF